MKTKIQPVVLALLLATLNSPLTNAFAQGALTPSGAPAPTMKSLDQIEPRTIVNAANTPGNAGSLYVINQPGSYYLAAHLTGVSGKHGLTISANNVTVNLNGFTMQGATGSTNGIYVPNAQTNVTVQNGTINGWGASGIYAPVSISQNVLVEHLNVAANGFAGIYLLSSSVVRDCNCRKNADHGIYAAGGLVTGCTANNNGSAGIYVTFGSVSGCTAQNNVGNGIIGVQTSVSGCTANNNTDGGIYVAPGCVTGCLTHDNVNAGIYVDAAGGTVSGNTCRANGTGIYINDAHVRIEGNQVTASVTAGIQINNFAGYTNNLVIKNSVFGNVANNYISPNTQIVGPIITATGTITSVNPWANFSF